MRYDLRGFGHSSVPGEAAYSHIGDLASLLGQLRLGPAHLVGLSLGANVALGFALAHPGLVRSLVLVSSGLPGPVWHEERPPDAVMAYAPGRPISAVREFWLRHPIFHSLTDYPQARAKLHEIVAGYTGWHWHNHNPMTPFTTSAAQLSQVRAPTLVVSGKRDVAGYREIAEVLAHGIPGARKVVFPDAGHVLSLERPDLFNDLVEAFFARADHAGA